MVALMRVSWKLLGRSTLCSRNLEPERWETIGNHTVRLAYPTHLSPPLDHSLWYSSCHSSFPKSGHTSHSVLLSRQATACCCDTRISNITKVWDLPLSTATSLCLPNPSLYWLTAVFTSASWLLVHRLGHMTWVIPQPIPPSRKPKRTRNCLHTV